MILARRRRSASACLAMARIMVSLRSMCLSSTLLTLMPQASVCSSRMRWTSALSFSRSASISSSSCWPSTERKRRLRELAGRLVVVLDLDDRLLRIDDAVVDDGVDLHRDVVPRDHVLRRHVEHARAQVDAHHLLDERHDDDEARPLHLPEAAEQEHHAALVFAQDADASRPTITTMTRQRERAREQRDQRLLPGMFPPRLDLASTSSVRPVAAHDAHLLALAPGLARSRRPDLAVQRTRPSSPSSSRPRRRCRSSPRRRCAPGGGAPAWQSPATPAKKAALSTAVSRRRPARRLAIGMSDWSGSNRNSAPSAKATMPPMPSTPKPGLNASATIRAMPKSSSASPP